MEIWGIYACIRYPHGYKTPVHRGVKLRHCKKNVLFLHISNFCSTFAVAKICWT